MDDRLARLRGHLKIAGSSTCRVGCALDTLALPGEQVSMDVGQHTTGGDGDTSEELVELFVVANGELDMAGDDALLIVVAGGVAGELENLSGEVLKDCGEVHRGTSTDACGVPTNAEVAMHTTDRELEPSLAGAGSGFCLLATCHV